MPRLSSMAATLLLLVACGGDGGSGPSSNANVQGTFIGNYTNTINAGVVYEGVLQLTQHGSNVTGTLTTNAGRAATVAATMSGTRMTGTFAYIDACSGSATVTADLTQNNTKLTGNYSSTDCLGQTSGGFVLIRQ